MNDSLNHEKADNNPVDPKGLEAVKAACRNFLGEVDGETEQSLFASLRAKILTLQYEYQKHARRYYARYSFGAVFQDAAEQLTVWMAIPDSYELFENLTTHSEQHNELFDECKAIKKFLAARLVDYERIQEFHHFYAVNLSEAYFFGKADWEKIMIIEHYTNQRDPRNGMEAALTAMEELKPVIAKGLQSLRTDVCTIYNEIFDSLEKEAADTNVSCDIYANRRKTIANINACNNTRLLAEFRGNAFTFRLLELRRILNAGPDTQESATDVVSYSVTGVLLRISNEKELNYYLAKLRKEMMSILLSQRVIDLK
jgi:hypothetical protein